MDSKLIHNSYMNGTVLLMKGAHGSIVGVSNCCSAAMLVNIGQNGFTTSPRQIWNTTKLAIPYEPVESMTEYYEKYKDNIYLLPLDYAYCTILEQVYTKITDGKGGPAGGEFRMWAGNNYRTRTWFIADSRKVTPYTKPTCMGFMHWVKEKGPGVLGRMHISPWAAGAHGGECKGGVWAPNARGIRAFLDEKIQRANQHAKAVAGMFPHYGAEAADDKVCKLW